MARAKGQEVVVQLVFDGVLLDTINDIRSFEMEAQLETLKEGYLGETTDRRDDIYRGVSGRLELHFENADILDLMRALIDRARRRVAGAQVNIKARINFPDGTPARILIPNVFFGPIPLGFASRSDYGTVSLSFEAQDFQRIAA